MAIHEELGRAFLEPPSESGAELHKEYVRLFLSPQGAPCPPWQSAWGDPPQLKGEPHHSALAWYRSYGFEPRDVNDPADHLGLLLLFYQHLLAAGAAEDEVAAFRSAHLAWVPDYCDRLEAEARLPYFVELARATRGLLAA